MRVVAGVCQLVARGNRVKEFYGLIRRAGDNQLGFGKVLDLDD